MSRLNTANSMMMATGALEVASAMGQLQRRVATAVIRRGLLAGAKVIGQEARRRAPVRKPDVRRPDVKGGALKKAIRWQSRGVFRDGSGKPVMHIAVVNVNTKPRGKPLRNPRLYAHLTEGGTKPSGKHPGIPAQRWLRGAYSAKRAEAMEQIRRVIARETAIEVAKLAGARRAGRAA